MSWSFVGAVNTVNVNGATSATLSLPSGVQGGDIIIAGWCFYNTTVTVTGFTTLQNANGNQNAHDCFWLGYRIAAGTAGSATTDTTFSCSFGATSWGESVVMVLRSTLGVGSVAASAEYHAAAGYVTACPDATLTIGGSGDLAIWGYAGQNSSVGGTATSFSGTGPSALSNFTQQGITGNGGGLGMGWKTGTGSPGGATANQAVDPTDFAIDITEAVAAVTGPAVIRTPTPGPVLLRPAPSRVIPVLFSSVLRANNAEGGTSGVTVTAGNSGGSSGNAFDSVVLGTGTTLVFDNTRAAHGGLSYKVTIGSTAADANVFWSTSLGTQPTLYFRVYLYYTAMPVASCPIFANSGGTHAGDVIIQTNLLIGLRDTGFTTRKTFTTTIPLNQWFRIEGYITGGAAGGAISCSRYDSMDSVTPAETQTVTGINTLGLLTQIRSGDAAFLANSGPWWFDDFAVSTSGPLGPAGFVLPEAGSGADALSIASTVALTETGTGTDALAIEQDTPLAEAGAGTDALAITSAVSLAEAGTGADALGIMPGLTEAGTGSDTLTIVSATPVALSEAGSGSDALGVMPGLTEAGSGTDALSVAAGVALAEAGSGTTSLGITVPAAFTESGTGTAALGVAIPVALTETGTGSDSLGIVFSVALPEAGAGTDTLAIASAATITDSDTCTAVESGFAFITSADACAAAEGAALIVLADTDTCTAAERELTAWPSDADACTATETELTAWPSDADACVAAEAGVITVTGSDACAAADVTGPDIEVYTYVPPFRTGPGGGWYSVAWGEREVLRTTRVDGSVLRFARELNRARELRFVSDADVCTAAESSRRVTGVVVSVVPALEVCVQAGPITRA